MNIGIVMGRYAPAAKTHMGDVLTILARWGARVDPIYPEEQVIELGQVRAGHDLYVLKTKTEVALSLAGALHAAGAAVLNPYPVSMALRNRIVSTRILREAGVPVPESYVVSYAAQLAPLLQGGPLIVKPYKGSRGEGIHVIRDAGELRQIAAGTDLSRVLPVRRVPTASPWVPDAFGAPGSGEPIFAQRYHPPDGGDRKIYSIGGRLFGVERPWPARTLEEKLGRPFALTPELQEIALCCGHAFGIDLYGVDIIESGGRPYVVDMSSFPGFKGVPEAPLRLAEYIYATARRALQGRPLASAQAGTVP